MAKTAPQPIDVQDFQFKLRSRLKVFDNKENGPFSKNCNLVAAASRFGLIFVGSTAPNFQAIQLKDLEQHQKSDGDKSDYPRREIPLPSPPKYISTNCEQTILAVTFERDGCPCVSFYDIKSFWRQNVTQIQEARLSATPGVTILDVNWNPTLAAIFTVCKSDGTLGVYELKNPGIDINELPAAAGATCFCWSPKGKQIAVGSRDGKITQYKPDLKAVKVINAPSLKEPHSLISLQWVSNYQFIGVFQPLNPDGPACLMVVDAPKTGEVTYTNYDDICYSNGTTRPPQFYMIMQQHWNVMMVASSNSMEVGVLGFVGDVWTQWIMGDAARAELPLSPDHQDTLPVGFAIDTGSTKPLPWGESSLPPAPLLLLLSHYGTLCCFSVVNLKPGIPSICAPPDPITDTTGANCFVAKVAPPQPVKIAPPVATTIQPQPLQQSTPKVTKSVTFGTSPGLQGETPSNFGQSSIFGSKSPQTLPTPTSLFGGQTTSVPVNQNTGAKLPPFGSSSLLTALTENKSPATPQFAATLPKPAVSQPVETVSQPKIISEVPSMPAEPVRDDAETQALFAQMVREECMFLESELKALLHQGSLVQINLGTDSDKTNIVKTADCLEEFFKEVVDISAGQSVEVHGLKQNLLQSWAWYEEAKSLHASSKDETMSVVMRAQPLDSASEKQLQDIRHASYYLESQLSQAHRSLDEQWEGFQDYCRKTTKIQIPTMEAIFQTLVKQNAIAQKQSYILKDIASKIRSKSRSAYGPSLLLSFDNPETLEDELQRLRLEPQDISRIQRDRVLNRSKCFTPKKLEKTRSFLSKRPISHVSAIKPQLPPVQMSPADKLKQLSMLGAKLSSVGREVNKKIDFNSAPPKTVLQKTETPPNTPIEGLQQFSFKFEQNNFKNQEKIFAPPGLAAKTTIPSSPNSAFVSTSFGAVSSSSTPVTSLAAGKSSIFGSTPPAAPKASPSFVLGTTLVPTANQPVITISANKGQKTFSFANPPLPSDVSIVNVTKSSGSSIFGSVSTTISKPSFSFASAGGATKATVAPTIVAATTAKSTASATSIFNSSTATTKTATTAPIFGATTNTAKAATTTSIFGATTNTASIIVNKPTTLSPATTSVFGSSVLTTPTNSPSSTKPFTFLTIPVPQSSAAVTTTVASTGQATSTVISLGPGVTLTPLKVTQSSAPTQSILTSSSANVPKSTVGVVATSQSSAFTSKSSIFGAFAATTNSQSSIFATPSSGAQPPSFSNVTKSSVFTPSTQTSAATLTTTAPLTFGVGTLLNVSGTQPLGTSPISPPTSPINLTTSVSSSGTPIMQAATFGTSTSASNAPKSSTFVPVSSPATTSFFGTSSIKPTMFGSGDATSKPQFGETPSTSVFGGDVAPKTSVFSTVSTPLFGTPPTTAQSSVFGGFGGNQQKSTIFGASPATTTSASIFGGSSTQTSIFGAAPAATTAQFGSSTFGTATTTAPFAQAKSPSTASVFGQTPFTSASATFGSPNTFGAASTAGSFGFSQTTGSLFANPATTTSGSVFGGTPAPGNFGTGGSVFGTPVSSSASPFGMANAPSGSVFASTASQPSSFSFAAAANNTAGGTSFGFGGLNVGSSQTQTTASFGFGQSPAANPFGITSSQEQKTPFGGENKSIFGSSDTTGTSGSIFGGSAGGQGFGGASQGFAGSGFGGQTAFGQQPAFGQSTFGGGSFASPQPGPFSGGAAGTVSQSGFGGGATFQKPNAFGGAPVFGATSTAFGAAPSFGGAPAFGAAPAAFGSPPKIFGSSSTPGGFGSAATSPNPSFGNLANQPTVGFGNLAQQAANNPATSTPFSGNSSFSSWR